MSTATTIASLKAASYKDLCTVFNTIARTAREFGEDSGFYKQIGRDVTKGFVAVDMLKRFDGQGSEPVIGTLRDASYDDLGALFNRIVRETQALANDYSFIKEGIETDAIKGFDAIKMLKRYDSVPVPQA